MHVITQGAIKLDRNGAEPRTKELLSLWPDEDKKQLEKQLEKWKKTVLSQKVKIQKVFQKEGSVSSANAVIRKAKQDED